VSDFLASLKRAPGEGLRVVLFEGQWAGYRRPEPCLLCGAAAPARIVMSGPELIGMLCAGCAGRHGEER
jgi:hypothetical protein